MVVPVFNEEASVNRSIDEWVPVLIQCAGSVTMLLIDDGANDRCLEVLRESSGRREAVLEVAHRENRGHDLSCLQAYREAVARKVDWVFPIDLDGQCDPNYFPSLWDRRNGADVIYGVRRWREDGLGRLAMTWCLMLGLRLNEWVWCADPNSPFRLRRTRSMAPWLHYSKDWRASRSE